MRVEAKTLDEAIIRASEELSISASKIKYELIQRPSNGFLGLFRRNAIINVLNKKKQPKQSKDVVIDDKMIDEICHNLQNLLNIGLYQVEIVEIKKYDNNSIYVKLDGSDAASIIGREGKRYKALSYLLHNWINSRYGIFVRLEISTFLENQIAYMENYIANVVDKVREFGKYTTKPLDGIVLKIAVDRLREEIKDKYIGIKNTSGDMKVIIIRDFAQNKNEE